MNHILNFTIETLILEAVISASNFKFFHYLFNISCIFDVTRMDYSICTIVEKLGINSLKCSINMEHSSSFLGTIYSCLSIILVWWSLCIILLDDFGICLLLYPAAAISELFTFELWDYSATIRSIDLVPQYPKAYQSNGTS